MTRMLRLKQRALSTEKSYMGWLLILIVVFMILRSNKKIWSVFVFFLSGALGWIVLNFKSLEQGLLPMLSGLFGVSMLLIALNNKLIIPKQEKRSKIKK